MDHSYRASEIADAGASTISVGGRRSGHRHQGDSQPIDRSMPRPVPIPEGAQTHIYFFIEELFFQAKIQETAKKLGVKVAFLKNDKDALAELTDGEENKPALIVFDLNNANAKPLTLIPKLKAKLKKSASIVGFLSHLQGDLKAKAVEAGCDVVMPRAAFSQNLPNLLRRYGVEEEESASYVSTSCFRVRRSHFPSKFCAVLLGDMPQGAVAPLLPICYFLLPASEHPS
jgi:CheY-like chemotaxis protein